MTCPKDPFKTSLMARSLNIHHILSQPEAYRNKEWEKTFFQAVLDCSFELDSEAPKVGPDGWPYLFVKTTPQATEPAARIIEWLASRGIGLVINAHKSLPDYVFTYGMLWNFKERKEFLSEQTELIKLGPVEIKNGEILYVGEPGENYLPNYVRKIIRQFLADQGVKAPQISMVSRDNKIFDLCFSLESLGQPAQKEHKGSLEALSWFLPQHYSRMILSEKTLPRFFPLKKA